MRTSLLLPFVVLVSAACSSSDADDASLPREPAAASDSKASTGGREDEIAPAGEPAATPARPLATDGDDEPTEAELAIDAMQDASCKGPFNCRLPNPLPDGNRITNPRTGTKEWPLAPGTAIVDGIGGSRGTVTEPTIQINYGQRKTLLGVPHVYAFAASTTNGAASSWVAESAVQQSLADMPTVLSRDPGKGDYEQVFTIAGGDPALYGDAKVVAGSDATNEAATDYLLRPGNVVNVLSALPGGGGVSNDTYPAGKVSFKRARGVASVYIFLYPKGSRTVIGSQRFVYGHVDGRFGWVARDALEPKAAQPGPSRTFCCAKCTGREASHRVAYAGECVSASKAYCAAESTRGAYESSKIGDCN